MLCPPWLCAIAQQFLQLLPHGERTLKGPAVNDNEGLVGADMLQFFPLAWGQALTGSRYVCACLRRRQLH